MYGLYIHIPFCLKKCKYCDFISFDNHQDFMDLYLNSLISEMQEYKGLSCDTLFIGGGTPTCLSENQLFRLLENITSNFNIEKNAEFTIEANPKTLTMEKLKILKKFDVNRISLGVQSFVDEELLSIGRIHNSKTALETIKLIKDSGFENFNIDLMSSLPCQTFESFRKSLEIAVGENPSHISCYSLILEEGTPLFDEYENNKFSLPNEDAEREMYSFAQSFLNSHGYKQYEISNFAKEGKTSAHNIKYWQCNEYVGIGLASHSYYMGERFKNTDNLSRYLSGAFHEKDKIRLTLQDRISEFMIMGLRMTDGISKKEFKDRFGFDIFEVFPGEIEKFLKTGFLLEKGDNICLSKEGISVSNSIMCEFAVCNLNNPD